MTLRPGAADGAVLNAQADQLILLTIAVAP
jgi:hypothetical protein